MAAGTSPYSGTAVSKVLAGLGSADFPVRQMRGSPMCFEQYHRERTSQPLNVKARRRILRQRVHAGPIDAVQVVQPEAENNTSLTEQPRAQRRLITPPRPEIHSALSSGGRGNCLPSCRERAGITPTGGEIRPTQLNRSQDHPQCRNPSERAAPARPTGEVPDASSLGMHLAHRCSEEVPAPR